MDLFDKVAYWADQGVEIDYMIIDQFKNGMRQAVAKKHIPLTTFTANVRVGDDYVYEVGHDCPGEALKDGVVFAEKHFPELMNDHYKNYLHS